MCPNPQVLPALFLQWPYDPATDAYRKDVAVLGSTSHGRYCH
jgi:hypothetical protein